MSDRQLDFFEDEFLSDNVTEDKKSPKNKKAVIIIVSILGVLLAAAVILTVFGVLRINKSRQMTDLEIASGCVNERERLISYAVSQVGSDSPYESSRKISEIIGNEIINGALSVARNDEGSFTVSVNGIDRFVIEVSDGLTGKNWVPTGCSFGYSVNVDAPHGSDVRVNGVTLTGGEKIRYPRLSVYEERYSDEYTSDRYLVGPLFGEPEIAAYYNGEQLIGPVITDDAVSFSYPTSMTGTYTYVAPIGAELLVNGVPLLAEASRSLVPYPYVSRFEEGTNDALTAFSVSVGNLFEVPETEAFLNGKKLECSDDGTVFIIPQEKLQGNYTVKAPAGYTVTVNGVSLGTAETVAYDIVPVLVNGCENYVSAESVPTCTEYEVGGLYFVPEIRCFSPDGQETEIDTYLSSGREYVFRRIETGSISSADIKTVSYFAKYFVRYEYNAALSRGTNYNTLRSMSPGGSPAYIRVQNMWNVVYYNTAYSSIQFGELSYYDYYEYDNENRSVTVVIPFSGVNGKVRYQFEMRLEILYNFNGKIRRIINFNELEEKTDIVS